MDRRDPHDTIRETMLEVAEAEASRLRRHHKDALDEVGILRDEAEQQATEIDTLRAEHSALQAIVNEQAENEGLWFIAKYATEAYLQSELRRLHEAIEGKTGDEIAREIVSGKQLPVPPDWMDEGKS